MQLFGRDIAGYSSVHSTQIQSSGRREWTTVRAVNMYSRATRATRATRAILHNVFECQRETSDGLGPYVSIRVTKTTICNNNQENHVSDLLGKPC